MANDGLIVELRGYNRVANKYRKFASDSADMLDDEIGEFTKAQRRYLKSKPYPPKRANQKYIRTGELANRWKATKNSNSRWAISNDRKGVKFVVGKKDQAWMHKNRWWIFEDEMSKATPKLTRSLTARIIEEWEGA